MWVCMRVRRCEQEVVQGREQTGTPGACEVRGLGGVLAGTTPDSGEADAPWQFCTSVSLPIKVLTC